ncbi:MAG: hypothetical protein KIH63_002085 [Candidatus Saccharibacteria bacterium]|nr:hypothetical protein [Candidatus Saccharibacteria bacterium]
MTAFRFDFEIQADRNAVQSRGEVIAAVTEVGRLLGRKAGADAYEHVLFDRARLQDIDAMVVNPQARTEPPIYTGKIAICHTVDNAESFAGYWMVPEDGEAASAFDQLVTNHPNCPDDDYMFDASALFPVLGRATSEDTYAVLTVIDAVPEGHEAFLRPEDASILPVVEPSAIGTYYTVEGLTRYFEQS